jgi:hypothetical protein
MNKAWAICHSLQRSWQRLSYYVGNFIGYTIPNSLYTKIFLYKLHSLTPQELTLLKQRADYYIRLDGNTPINENTVRIVGEYKFPFKKKHRNSAYFFDLYESIRCFNPKLKFHSKFGDVYYETELPTLVKSRPITEGHTNSVLCKLDKFRHFHFLHDGTPFREKKNLIVFRNVVRKQPHRTRFLELYATHPLCDAGQINNDTNTDHPEYVKPFLSLEEQLKYKFIACIQGHDVATNLKWVMSSNSLAVMPKPTLETWYMEGSLIGGYHYVEIKDDYSDLIEKMEYYIQHPEEAEAIISHAHEYIRQFSNSKLEQCIQYEVVKRYFEITNK